MKKHIKCLLDAALIVFLLSCLPLVATTPGVPWYTPPAQGTDPTYDDATFTKLKALKVSVQWVNIPLEVALKDLSSKSQQADPDHLGIQFTAKIPSDTQKVSITITDVSIHNVLGYIAQQTHLSIKIHKGEVVLLPLKEANKPEQ